MSDPTGTDELARWLRQTPSAAQGLTRGLRPLGIAFGVVRAVDQITTPWTLSIAFSGSPTQVDDVGYLVSSYAPTVGDNVVALINGSDYLVIGSQGPSAATSGGGGGGGTPGVTWPLAFGGDECFQPDGVANDVLCLKNDPGADGNLTITAQISQQVVLSTVNLSAVASNDIDVDPSRDFNSIVGRDFNLTVNEDINLETSGPGRDVNVSAAGSLNLAGTSSAYLGAAEIIFYGATAAPPDVDVSNSQFALWLDDTPGLTFLNIKAKDSGGTVRTATIALT